MATLRRHDGRVVRAVVLGVVAALACAAPAGAFTPPELFVRLQPWNSHEPVSDWIPLSSAPVLNYLGGYQIGYRLQASGVPNEFQHVALTVTGVPDGAATQPHNAAPYCVGRAGVPGTIVEAAPELQFEGNGTYAVNVAVGPGSGGPADCLAGPGTAATAAAFSVDVHVTPQLAGDPFVFRATALRGTPFVGINAAAPPGGSPETRCALDAAVQPDGSVAGRLLAPKDAPSPSPAVPESIFTRPGTWTCVSRGVSEGVDDAFNTASFGTPWSAPLRVDVHSDFRRVRGRITGARTTRPRLAFTAEFPEAAAGGTATLKLRRALRCRRTRYVLKAAGTYRAGFDGKGRSTFRVRRPRAAGYYLGVLSIARTRLYRAGADANPVLLQVLPGGALSFVAPSQFPRCPGFA